MLVERAPGVDGDEAVLLPMDDHDGEGAAGEGFGAVGASRGEPPNLL